MRRQDTHFHSGDSNCSCCNTAPQRHRVSHQYSFNGAGSMLHDLTSLQRCLRTVSKLMQSEAYCYQHVSCYYCSSRLRREGASGHMLVASTLAVQEVPNRFLGSLRPSLSHHVETTDTMAFVLFSGEPAVSMALQCASWCHCNYICWSFLGYSHYCVQSADVYHQRFLRVPLK